MTRRRTAKTYHNGLEVMNPNEPDQHYMGDEPLWPLQPDPDQRTTALGRALNWYNYYYDRRQARAFYVQWLNHQGRTEDALRMARANENLLMTSRAWLARMNLMGLELTEHEHAHIRADLEILLSAANTADKVVQTTKSMKTVAVKAARPNIQEIMRERAAEAGGELEGMLDEFILANFPRKHNYNVIEKLSRLNILPQHCEQLADHWEHHRQEFALAAVGLDEQLAEGYSHINKTQLKAAAAFCEWVITEIRGYANTRRVARAPRARKAVPVTKIVAKLKYMREYSLPNSKLKLTSVDAVKVHGAAEVWLYDTARRKLIYYAADSHVGSLSVKNSSLLGWDKAQSAAKTLRKPEDQLRDFVNASKTGARRQFKDIKTVSTAVSGRISESMIILKAA